MARKTKRVRRAASNHNQNLTNELVEQPPSEDQPAPPASESDADLGDVRHDIASNQHFAEVGEEPEQDAKHSQGEPHRDNAVNFADLEGIGDHDDSDSDSDTPLETMKLSELPSQVMNLARNDEAALTKKLTDIAIFQGTSQLPFTESLQITMPISEKLSDRLAMDDLKRERRFAELATASVHIGLEKLRKSNIKFRRPDDYFAEMVKTDHQMSKVKARIMHQKEKIEAAEKRRNNRDITKNRKKVRAMQLEQQQEKKRKANEEIQAFSRLRKQRLKQRAKGGQSDDDEFPIDLLDVEQLDSENRFQTHGDIVSGKKKAWRPDANKGKDGKKGKAKRPGKEARKKKRGAESGTQKFGKTGGRQRGAKVKTSGGIKKQRR